MPTLLDGHITHDGPAPAIVDAAGTTSWETLGERVNRWMHLLDARGLRPGDRLVCVLGNRRETFEVLLAGLHSGLTVVPANWHLTAAELRYLIADSEARAVVTEPGFLDAVTEALTGLPETADVPVRLVLGAAEPPGPGSFAAVEPLLAAASPAEPAGQRCGDTMLYTSGTTGVPKGVVNGLFVAGAPFSRVTRLLDYARVVLGVAPRERFLLDAPWYHSSQMFFALIALLLGNRLVIRPRFDPKATLAVIDAEQISSAHFVPTQLVRLLREESSGTSFSGASLRRVWHGGGPCPPEVKRRMIDWWGPVLLEYYGATEGGAVTMINSREWLRRPGSVGRAVLPNEVVILGDEGGELPPGEIGRVFVRRRSGRTFHYHNAPEKTRAAHRAGDMFTFGELGRVDADGYLYLTGRAQDLIVTGGVNVYPAEVEAVLLTHPAVRDAAVIGVPDDEFGERVVAVVEAQPGLEGGLDGVLDVHCRRSLAGFKAPRAYRFVGRLPREATGKIRKDVLRERGLTRTEPPNAAERSPIDATDDHRRADASRHR
jgi:acyl-CoA synthetase (AMP-forming)/AMP-acid ligase II